MSGCFKVSSSGPFANTIVLGLGQNIIDILRGPLAHLLDESILMFLGFSTFPLKSPLVREGLASNRRTPIGGSR